MPSITPTEAAIRERISREGRITFAQFMEMALYAAPGCYYCSEEERIGARGDYFTSPEVHPAFGALVARQVEQVWVALERPATFDLVEVGAGTGALARDILSYTARFAPEFHQALRYHLVERSPAQRRRQEQAMEALGAPAERVIWRREDLSTLPEASVNGCFLSNEFLDALPVHRVQTAQGELMELYVEWRDGKFTEVPDKPSSAAVAAYFERLGFLPPEGCRAEVNLAALDWMVTVARLLGRGVVLTLDYGYTARELYSQRHCDGTLLCFYRHTLNADPYARIGLQDMTTHVDFTSLVDTGRAAGLQPVGITNQRSFLSALGMGRYLELLPRRGLRGRDFEANRAGLRELLKPQGLGRVQVLIQQKGLQGFVPAGLRPQGLRVEDLGREVFEEPPPLLTRSHLNLTEVPEADLFLDTEGMWRELMGEEEA